MQRAIPVLLVLSLVACSQDGPKPFFQLGDGQAGSEDAQATDGSGGSGSRDGRSGGDNAEGWADDVPAGPEAGCIPSCQGKQCGSDGCGGSCGPCEPDFTCVKSACVSPCDHAACGLGKVCIDALNQAALCGGTLDFDHDLTGKKLGIEVSVESLYGPAGVLIATMEADSVAATNPYEVQSPSGHNSCASLDQWDHYWLDDLIIRFVLPDGNGWIQGVTHYVSLYIAQTIPDGIRVDFFAPDNPPGLPGSTPFQQLYTQQKGTAFVELMSPKPIGYIKVLKAKDPDFTIDDLTFGAITAF